MHHITKIEVNIAVLFLKYITEYYKTFENAIKSQKAYSYLDC